MLGGPLTVTAHKSTPKMYGSKQQPLVLFMTPRAAWASLPVWAAWADLGRACSHICRHLGGWTATGGPRLAHLSGSWLALDGATQ